MDSTNLTHPPRGCGFDLNEPADIEPEPASDYVVRAHLQRRPALTGPAARVPSAAPCGACGGGHGGSEKIFVCDFCERVFHILCMGSRDVGGFDELICADCFKNGGSSKLWPIGPSGKKRIILDMNAPPPRDGDAEGGVPVMRKHSPGGCSLDSHSHPAPVAFSKLLHSGSGLGVQRGSDILSSKVREGFDLLQQRRAVDISLDKDQGFPVQKFSKSRSTAVSIAPQNLELMYLQALKELISTRHGVLDDGWRVELKPSISYGEMYPVYCAPDGKKFESMQEVASYLGLISSSNMGEPRLPSEVSLTAQVTRRRKPSRNLYDDGFPRARESLGSAFCEGPSSDSQGRECPSISRSNLASGNVFVEGPDGTGSSEANDYLPLQFEDFYILSVGKVDLRPAYHDATHIWPVGFRSCWHDKITGSIFLYEVLDGGDSGPVFKVTRSSCSVFPPPSASTVYRLNLTQFSLYGCEGSYDKTSYSIDCDHEESIQMMLADPVPPMENDVISCLGGSVEACNVQTSSEAQATGTAHLLENPAPDNDSLSSEIGEISVEDRSLSSAWSLITQKFIKSWSEISKQKGACIFHCKHAENGVDAQDWEIINSKSDKAFKALSKFGGSLGSFNFPTTSRGEDEFQMISVSLEERLENDRFGLDTAFVQEILEHLTGIQACYNYKHLCSRSSSSTLATVKNGLLAVTVKDRMQTVQDNFLGILSRKLNRAHRPEDCVMVNSYPPGKPLCSRIPHKLIGDVFQVWELFHRFYEVLCLEEPVSLDELEGELINPCSDGFNIIGTIEKEIAGIRNLELHRFDSTGGQAVSSSKDTGPFVSRENSSSFIEVDTRVTEKAVNTKVSTDSDSRVCGVVLTKAHNAVLKVLVSELLSRVAAFVDPSFDSGEAKSRRGRKKDVDCLNSARRAKLNMLPLNELTWPELARRYILSFLSMDGNLESPEITTRESGKVFCCLQGDGGVLCGSLAGVAGMEADALILAEARKEIFGLLKRGNDLITTEREEISEGGGASENSKATGNDIPEWAQVLEPVRKLPTNVGTRIRNCVHSALEKNPPEWARKVLEHSISKGVYKGNASGPTKRAVLSVLAEVSGQEQLQRNDKGRKRKTPTVVSISDLIMKQCRIVLRSAAAADDAKVFCTLLGRKLISLSDNDDEGLLGSPAIVSRPLDFRTIDLRLAAGSYGRSHEAFLEDVREFWNNVRIAYRDRPDLIELAETLSENFESLYEKKVITLVNKLSGYAQSEPGAYVHKETGDFICSMGQIPKAPWEDGVCKVCGIDRDDDSVLLCDSCDAEYHTYCLNPPLPRIPEGHWYCPSCINRKSGSSALLHIHLTGRRKKKTYQGEITRSHMEKLTQLASLFEEREYWDFTTYERAFMLKFLCDELLNSALIRQHLDYCAEKSAELHPKLRSLSGELRSLKSESHYSKMDCERSGNSSKVIELPQSESLPQESGQLGKESCLHSELQESLARSNTDSALLDQQSQAHCKELLTRKKEIAILNNSIRDVSSQLLKLFIRREFLGYDAAGRLYWAFITPSGGSSIIVDGSESKLDGKLPNFPAEIASWVTYETEAEIKDLLCWLKDNDPKDKALKESIVQWQKLRIQDCQQSEDESRDKFRTEKPDYFGGLLTKAASLLEKKYGLCYKSETPDILKKREKAGGANDRKLFRCECLELIWPSTIHCFFCHRTFLSQSECKGHNGKCRSDPIRDEKGKREEKGKSTSHLVKGKGKAKYNFQERNCGDPRKADGCPFNYEEICSKFVTRNSNKEIVKEIGLIGSGGVPSFLPEPSPYLGESTLLLIQQKEKGNAVNEANAVERSAGAGPVSIGSDTCSRRLAADDFAASRVSRPTLGSDFRMKKTISNQFTVESRVALANIPITSTIPLVGKAAKILSWLKICLLDMDAALSDEALRSSRTDPERRLAWRSFVKSSATIYKVIQAMIILEDMIKPEFLKNDWWHWSSLSAAIKTANLSSLALRIYALDASIMYEKPGATDNVPSSSISISEQKSQPGSDSPEKSRVTRKSSKKRKEREG